MSQRSSERPYVISVPLTGQELATHAVRSGRGSFVLFMRNTEHVTYPTQGAHTNVPFDALDSNAETELITSLYCLSNSANDAARQACTFSLPSRHTTVNPSFGTSTTSRFRAFESSQEPPNPVDALFWQTKPQCLRQPPETTQMPISNYLHAQAPFFLHSPHKHTAQYGRHDDDQKRPQEMKQRNSETNRRKGRRLSHSRQLLGEY